MSDYEPLLEPAGTDAGAKRLHAYLLYRAGRNDEAMAAIDSALQDDAIPSFFLSYNLHLFAAMAHHRAGDRDEAALLFSKADELMEERRASPDAPQAATEARAPSWFLAAVGAALRREAEENMRGLPPEANGER